MAASLVTLGQQVFFPSLTRGGRLQTQTGALGFIQFKNREAEFGRKRRSKGVAGGERGDGHKNTAAHESQSFQPLTCGALSHAECLQRSDGSKTAHYGPISVRVFHPVIEGITIKCPLAYERLC